jgi:hypothetical protein
LDLFALIGHRVLLLVSRFILLASHPFLTLIFIRKLRYVPDLALPRRYNELFFWRKVMDHNPVFVTLTDKLMAKEYVRERCPDLPIARTLWSGSDPTRLPADLLAGDVMVKANHGCDANLHVRNGTPSRGEVVGIAAGWMRKVFGRRHGEWAYQGVRPTIFIEEKLELGGGDLPTDLKVQAFDGTIEHCWAADKAGGQSLTYDPNAAPLAARDAQFPADDQVLPDTPLLRSLVREAVGLSKRLSIGLDHVRVDFMIARGRLYFGELTVYSAGGYDTWNTPAISQALAQAWDIRKSAFLTTPQRGLLRLYAKALRAVLDARAARS